LKVVLIVFITAEVLKAQATNDEMEEMYNSSFNSLDLIKSKISSGSSADFIEGRMNISDFNGSISISHTQNIVLPNNLNTDFTLNYLSNLAHSYNHQFTAPDDGLGMSIPGWIMGFHGFGLQTLNFEKNYFILEKSGTDLGSYQEEITLQGDEIPLLIPGYHYSNKYFFDNIFYDYSKHRTSVGSTFWDEISILKSDGSVLVLHNTNGIKRRYDEVQADDSQYEIGYTGIYADEEEESKGYAIVEWKADEYGWNDGLWGLRDIYYKPGNGLTYYFSEEYVDFEDYEHDYAISTEYGNGESPYDWFVYGFYAQSSFTLGRRTPRTCYLKEITSHFGDKVTFEYDNTGFGKTWNYGRKFLKEIKYISNDDETINIISIAYNDINPSVSAYQDRFRIIITDHLNNDTFTLYLSWNKDGDISGLGMTGNMDSGNILQLDKIVDELNRAEEYTYSVNSNYNRKSHFRYITYDPGANPSYSMPITDIYKLQYPVSLLDKKNFQNKIVEFTYWDDSELDGSVFDTDYYTWNKLFLEKEIIGNLAQYIVGAQNWGFSPRPYSSNNMNNTARDNYTTTMVKSVTNKLYDSASSQEIELSEEEFTYTWDGPNNLGWDELDEQYDPEASIHANIKTVRKVSDKDLTNDSSPDYMISEKYYNTYKLHPVNKECALGVGYLSAVKIAKEKFYAANADDGTVIKEYDWEVGGNTCINSGSDAILGNSPRLNSISEYIYKTSLPDHVQKYTTFNREYETMSFPFTVSGNQLFDQVEDEKDVLLSVAKTIQGHVKDEDTNGDPVFDKSITESTTYENYIPATGDFSGNTYNYSIGKVSRVLEKNESLIKSDREFQYYPATNAMCGKLEKEIIHSNDGSRQSTTGYIYETSGKYKGYTKTITDDKGLTINHFYPDDVQNTATGKVIHSDNSETGNVQITHTGFQVQPFKTETSFGTTSLTRFTAYDTRGNLLYEVDENGYISKFLYDEAGKIRKTFEPGSFPVGITDPGINDGYGSVEYLYDDANWIPEVTTYQYPDLSVGSPQKIETKEYFSNDVISFIKETKNESDVFVKKLAAEYNYLGLVSSEEDGEGRIAYNYYDNLSNLKETRFGSTGVNAPSKKITYTYNKYDPDDLDYSWHVYRELEDEEGKIKKVYSDIFGDVVKEVLGSNDPTIFEYNSINQLEQVESPGGITTTYTYDDFGNLASKSNPDYGTYQYKYDKFGRLRYQYHIEANELVFNNYDELDRLLSMGVVNDYSQENFTSLNADNYNFKEFYLEMRKKYKGG
jgi:YD repeat-containing protein